MHLRVWEVANPDARGELLKALLSRTPGSCDPISTMLTTLYLLFTPYTP